MVERLKAKPGGDRIQVELGDFATTRVPGEFTLAYLVYNTINNLTTQEDQVSCFQNAAAHLKPGGCFVIEVERPSAPAAAAGGETVRPFTVTASRLGFDEYDIANQGLISHHYWMEGDRFRGLSVPFRYVWPAELDLMARLAGMTLRERWASWDRQPFTSESGKHISVWEKST